MRLELCPYCEQPGWVMTVKTTDDGFEVGGKCWTCGYKCGVGTDSGSTIDESDDIDRPGRPCPSTERFGGSA